MPVELDTGARSQGWLAGGDDPATPTSADSGEVERPVPGCAAVEADGAYGRSPGIDGCPRLDPKARGADVNRMTDPRAATMDLLARRAAGATICPSEVARALSPADWRGAMPSVHAAIDGLIRDGLVRLSWKGEPLEKRSGPYRIGRGGDD